MKQLLLSMCLLMSSLSMNAQLADGSTAPDFTATDINGQSHNLYTLLNNGKAVVLDFSATWCGPCWSYHNSGGMKTFYNTRGPAAPLYQANVFFIEDECSNTTGCLYGSGGGGTPFQACSGTSTQGNWVANTPYPIIDNCSISNNYSVAFFPTVYMVCPNKKIYLVGQASAATLDSKMLTLCGITPGSVAAPLAYALNSTTNTSCANGSNGAISISPIGGKSPYTYLWSNGATTALVSNLAAGAYYCTITDGNNSTLITNQIAIFNGPTLNASATVVNHQACGTAGAINLSASGGNGGLTYSWSNGATSQSITNVSQSGAYAVTVTDNKGCTKVVNNLNLTAQNNQPTATAGQPQTVTCAVPQATLQGAVAPLGNNYSYTWSVVSGAGQLVSGASTLAPKVDGAGTFKLIIKDNLSLCESSSNVVVSANVVQPPASITPSGALTCVSNTVTLNANPCPTCSVAWSGGTLSSTSSSVNVTAPATYATVVTNTANGCTATATQVVTANTSAPNVAIAAPSALTCATATSALVASSTTANATFAWTGTNGGSIAQGNTSATATATSAGNYSVVVTNPENGCTATQSVSVTQNGAIPAVALVSAGNINCINAASSITATIPTGADYTYVWTVPTGATASATLAQSAPVAGNYTLVVTNTTNGCAATKITKIEEDKQAPALNVNVSGSITCINSSATLAVTNPNAAYQYTWSNTATPVANISTATVSSVGTYTANVTNPSNGCKSTKTVNVLEDKQVPVITSLGTALELHCKKSIVDFIPVVTNVINPTYAWSSASANNTVTNPTTANASVEAPGTYSVVVTNPMNGCTSTKSVVVTESEVPSLNLLATAANCYGDCSGKITPQVTKGKAPFTYVWSNASTASSLTNICAGDYNLKVTDAYGCEVKEVTKVTQPNVLVVSTTIKNASDVINSGSVTLNATGGTAPYQYLWNTGATTSKLENLKAGTYTCDVVDANGCKKTVSAVIITVLANQDVDGLELLTISPNPTQDRIEVKMRLQQAGDIGITVFDATGKTILTTPSRYSNILEERFDLSNVPAGIYLVTIRVNQQIMTRQVVKQ